MTPLLPAIAIMVLVLACTGSRTHGATATTLDLTLARESAEVTNTAGRVHRGILDGFREGRLHLRLATDGGEVGYSFAPAEIAQLTLPGEDLEAEALHLIERDRPAEAQPLLEALGRHRIRYLAVLTEDHQRVLWRLVQTAAAEGDPHMLAGIIRVMEPLATTPVRRAALLEAGMHVAQRLDQIDEARDLARQWCALADPAGGSAIGWRVLAQTAYENQDFENAHWIALQPIAFSGHLPMNDLDLCYAFAIAAADHLGDTAGAQTLWHEMQARQITWPADPAFEALRDHYARAADAGVETLPPFFPPSIAMPIVSPPEGASSIVSLDHLRKLIGPEPTP